MDTKQRLDELTRVHKFAADEILRLTEKLAAEQMPELRHGDYGPAEGSEGRLVLKEYGKDKLRSAGAACCAREGVINQQMPDIVFGNIFDDLDALQEPLEDFVMDLGGEGLDVNVKWWEGGIRLHIDQGSDRVSIKPKYLPAFILNLQRMYATWQRKQANG